MHLSGQAMLSHEQQIEQLREIERARLRALVAGDMAAARALHADDFQLVTPLGTAISKEQYLGPSPMAPCATSAGSRK